jgi:uncharacterized Ntn-hydrolase superfamily protein
MVLVLANTRPISRPDRHGRSRFALSTISAFTAVKGSDEAVSSLREPTTSDRKERKQSAAMIVVKKGVGVWLNNDVVLRLQVDDNPEPIKEMRRLVELAALQRRPQG